MPPLNGLDVLEGATITPSGGTATTFASAGIRNDSVDLNNDDDTDLRTRRQITASIRTPKVAPSAPNGYSQARAALVIKFPRTLANGNTTVDTVRIEISRDPETDNTDLTEMRKIGAQCLIDADFDDFYEDLSLS